MKRPLFASCLAFAALALAACSRGGSDDGGASEALDIFFAPEQADSFAHGALPDVADLPGSGWEVIARDDFDEDDDDTFDAIAEREPICSGLRELEEIGGVFSTKAIKVSGQAQVEFERETPNPIVSQGVIVEVRVRESVDLVADGWTVTKETLERDETDTCMTTVFEEGFRSLNSDVKAEATARNASSSAPRDGVALAYDIDLEVPELNLDMTMEFYFWTYGNAEFSVAFAGPPNSLASDLTGPTLEAIVNRVEAAAASQAVAAP